MTAVNEGKPQDNAQRDAEIYRLRVVNCLTQDQIAARFGISQQRVGVILAEVRAKMPPVDLEGIRRQAIALHEDVIMRAYELAELAGTPVFVGQRGDIGRDENGNVVRDYGARVAALKLVLAADAERRKLMGADAASKQEISGSVRYEIVGVDISALR